MATVEDHYENVLSGVYSWMFGGFEIGIQRNAEFFERNDLTPRQSKIAIDLGAGCGFQSVPLAHIGYKVVAIDLDNALLSELESHSTGLPIQCVRGDLMHFDRFADDDAELIVCMTDTILHLNSEADVKLLFSKAFIALEKGGKFVITFRDLTPELKNVDRIIPVRSDDNIIFTCFLEYEPETVKVHDVVYKKSNNGWSLLKSFYRKLRLSKEWVTDNLSCAGFEPVNSHIENGVVTVIAVK